MMEYFRRFLLFLRQKENTDKSKISFLQKLILAAFIGVAIGVLLDNFLPFNFIVNMIRGIVANLTAITLFGSLYLLNHKGNIKKTKADSSYRPLRKMLSYNQRLNLSILIGVMNIAFLLMSGNPSPVYTFKAILVIVVTLCLIAFARRGRDEFLKSIYEIPDIRDLEFNKKVQARKSEAQKEKTKESLDEKE